MRSAQNLLVIKTSVGSAQPVAAALWDREARPKLSEQLREMTRF